MGALDTLQAKVGPIDEFVAKRLQMPVGELRNVMAAEQIDGVALAIDQIETGGALIIGDETGIGKGRQGAAIIRYAKLTGKLPIFFTKDPKLFTDMYGDLLDIHTDIKPFILGSPDKATIVDAEGNAVHRAPGIERQKAEIQRILAEGIENAGYDSIFVTYSQVNVRNARQEFLEAMAQDNNTIIILDEAHEAAGDAKTSMQAVFMSGGNIKRGKGPDMTTISLPGLLTAPGTQPGRGGILYMSATYAKRSENLPVYFRTSLSKAADSFPTIVNAMKRGGVALQQAVSESLAKSGQYVRRERDFTGVSYSMKRLAPADPKQLIDRVNQVTDVLSSIVRFNHSIRAAVALKGEKSTAMTESQMSMTDFASIVHNQLGQLLLSAKADAVVDEAIAAHKAGEKPLVALMNTMESFLDSFVEEAGIAPGEPIRARWNELVKHALERSLRITEKFPDGSTQISTIDPDEYGMGDAYRRIQEMADEIEVPFPISPIDYIIQKLARAGVKMGELTGRETGIEYSNLETGEGIYRKFRKANKNVVVNRFNSGEYEGLLLNASGSTGLSAHASEKFKDQRPRHMIIGQPALDINTFVQTLGRIKRTGMVLRGRDASGKPYGAKYSHLVLPLQAELRPAAIAAKKMKSLNANTTAEADNAIKIESEDLMNKYGDRVVAEYLYENPRIQLDTGLAVEVSEEGAIEAPADLARKFTGRMALLPDEMQRAIYEDIVPAYKELIEQLKATNEYDLEIAVHDDWDGRRTSDQELVPGTDESNIFTASVRVQKWEVKDSRHVPTGPEMEAEFIKKTGGKAELTRKWGEAKKKGDEQIATRRAQLQKHKAEAKNEQEMRAADDQLERLRITESDWSMAKDSLDDLVDGSGRPVGITNEETLDYYDGMLVDLKFPTSGSLVSGRKFRIRFSVNAPGGVLHLNLLDLRSKWSYEPSGMEVGEIVGKPTGSRYERTFIVGNPIRGYEATGGKGKVVRFLSQDKRLVTGLLMPNKWTIKDLAKDPRLDFVDGAAAAAFLRNESPWGRGTAIQAAGGNVTIQRARYTQDKYNVTTPAAKNRGGVVYLNEAVRQITGDFTKVGNKMTAEINATDLAKVADAISAATKSRFRAVGDAEYLLESVKKANEASAKAQPDLAAKLESLKLPTNKTTLSVFGIPEIGRAVWNTALDIAIQAVKAGRTLAEALDAAMKHLREKVKGFDEAKASKRMRAHVLTKLEVERVTRGPQKTLHPEGTSPPPNRRPLGVIDPSTIALASSHWMEEAGAYTRRMWRAFAMKQAPRMTDSSEKVGEAAVRYVASFHSARMKGEIFAHRVLEGLGISPLKFGAALTEDNLRSIKEKFQAQAADAIEKGDEPAATVFQAKADAVTSLIGKPGSPFKTEQEYQSFLADERTQLAVQRHIQLWMEQKDPIFREANDLNPEKELAERGVQTGARINLKSILPDEKGSKPIGRPPGFRQLATLKRRDPFARRATGAGQVYEGDYTEIMANGFERELPVAKQHAWIKALIENGDAKVADREVMPDLVLKGEQTKGYLMRLNPWRGKFLHVRRSLADEFKVISGLDEPTVLPVATPFNRVMTWLSIKGFAEPSAHVANHLMKIFTGIGPTSNPLVNALLKVMGRADLLYSLPKVFIRAFQHDPEHMLKLFEMQAAKEPYKGLSLGRILNLSDQGIRFYSDELFTEMAKAGWVEDTETNRREFINEIGNYEKRLQPLFIRKLRETQIQPFATAMQTFNVMAARRLVLAPGVKATSNWAALALKMDVLGGWIGAVVLLVALNKLVSGTATGPEGTRLGAVGWVGEDGKIHDFNVLGLMGYGRALNITGIGPYIQAKRQGLPPHEQMDAAARSVASSALGTVMGPGPRFVFTALTGQRPTMPWIQQAPPAFASEDSLNPFNTQFGKNVETAAIESSPILSSLADIYHGEPTSKIVERQFSRWSPKAGMKEETAEKLAEIIAASRLNKQVEWLAREARKLDLPDRRAFVREYLDVLEPAQRDRAMDLLTRKGVFKYR